MLQSDCSVLFKGEIPVKKTLQTFFGILFLVILTGASPSKLNETRKLDNYFMPPKEKVCAERHVRILKDGECEDCANIASWFSERSVPVERIDVGTITGWAIYASIYRSMGKQTFPLILLKMGKENLVFSNFSPKDLIKVLCFD